MNMNNDLPEGSRKSLNPGKWVDKYGSALYAYALVRVRTPDLAEEVVQETFLAAFKGRKRFQGRSSEKTWLIGILKRKIIDHFRKASRERPLTAGDIQNDSIEEMFDRNGHWIAGPSKWPFDPARSLEQKEFMKTLQACLSKLPPRLAQVFVLRELEGLATKEICDLLDISANNLNVMLYRARMHLKHHLEKMWFGDTGMEAKDRYGKAPI